MKQLALPSLKVTKRGEFNGKVTAQTKENKRISKGISPVSYRVLHETPGRIRFRVPKVMHDLGYIQALHILVALEEKIKGVKVKSNSGSVTFYYQRDLPQAREYFSELLQLANHPSVLIHRENPLSVREDEERKISWAPLKMPLIAVVLALFGGSLSIPPVVIGATLALASLPVARRALDSLLQEGKLNVDFLDATAITIMTAQSRFLTSGSMLILIQLGETIRELTARSSQRKTLDLLSSLSKVVWVERNGEKQKIPIEQLQPEDTVIVYPGEQIPVDGHILRGEAIIDEQKLTGESMPVVKGKNEMVYASTLVREGQIYVLAERLGEDTKAGQALKLLQTAPIHDTRMENYAAKIADCTVVPTLLMGALVFALTRNPARTAALLTIDFTTGIRVSMPTTVMAALMGAARNGVLIRSGRALEQLAQVDAIVFDKTGTLTQGDVKVVAIKTADESISMLEVLELAAAAEQRITHPVAEAIIRCANYHEVEIPPRDDWSYQVGLGIRAQIKGKAVLVGSERFLVHEGIELAPLYERNPELKQANCPLIYVAREGKILGILQYTDPLRPESARVIKTLREEMGAQIHILTGDNQQRAAIVAKALEIPPSQTHAEAFPETKAEVIQKLHNEGKTVAFVGDGLNDSAALAYADVSVSFRDGSDVARETADVVLMRNNLQGLVDAIILARKAKQIIYQNTAIVAIPNFYGLALATTIGLNPMTATMINNGSSVLAGVNGLRPVFALNSEDESS